MWREVVDLIKRESSLDIVKSLKISFEGLQDKEKTIFLDIACFFRGWSKDETIEILKSYDSGAHIRLHGLIEKSLVFISEYNTIQMHDLIQDMGRCVVKEQKDSGKPTRLWNVQDFEDVMVNNIGTMAVEAIWIPHHINLCFSKEAMKNMQRLRILFTLYSYSEENDGSIEYLSNNLCWVYWPRYSWKLLPQNFNPTRLVHLDLSWSSLHHLWNETKQLPSLRRLDLCWSKSLKRTPDFTGMPNLEYLDLSKCESLEEVHHSLRCSRKLIELNLYACKSLKKFPYVNVDSLESLDLYDCSSLEKLPEILGIMKLELVIMMSCSGIREIPSSIIHPQSHIIKLDLSGMNMLVSLPSSICKLKDLVELDVSRCSKLESLPEGIGDLEKLEELHASYTLISRPPSSIIRLYKLKLLTFANEKTEDSVYFVFPQVNEGLRSLEELNLSYCNLIDGGVPEDIGSLSSLKKLNLSGNNFEHLPRSIAQLGSLRSLDLSDCQRLKELPEIPQQLNTIDVDWSSDWICNSLFQNMSSLQHDISASDSLSLRVFKSGYWLKNIPSWFHHQKTGRSVSVKLPENWYVSDNFLGFAACCIGKLIDDITAHLIPLCGDRHETSWMNQTFSLSNHSESAIHFLLVPLAGLWHASNANGKTPNDYGCLWLYTSSEIHEFGVRLLYKDELQIGMRRSRDEEGSSSSSKKQRSQVQVPLLQLFPEL